MAEPTSTIAMAAPLAAGLTIFGVATGLHPEILLAGLAGGLWALSYHPPMPIMKRASITVIAAIVAGYMTPAIAVGVTSFSAWPQAVTADMMHMPVALLVGLLCYRVLGPAIYRFANKKAEEVSK